MASSDALWNEVARLLNIEFFERDEMITGKTLQQLIVVVQKELTENDVSV